MFSLPLTVADWREIAGKWIAIRNALFLADWYCQGVPSADFNADGYCYMGESVAHVVCEAIENTTNDGSELYRRLLDWTFGV